uniref:Glutathione hydrolase n=1 Tax=Oncorhynchus kisutch TaxID=8019 RepID=A0A8C7HT75_ONCKI
MYNPANDAVAGYSSGTMTEKDPSLETTLGSAYSPVDYMSITSFPRLPEDDVVSGENTLKSRKDDDNFLSEQDTDPDLFLKSARLQRLPSSASDLASHDITPLRETTRDPLAEGCACQRDGLTVIITACLTFATGVTIALIMQIYFGDPQIFNQGAVVTDVAQCTSLGFEALEKQGSSVDAAIAAALCLGIIHPHTSGIGGGGVMLVHDIRRNESRVIDFSETAPSAILEDMLQTNLELKPGLMVGVPGMLSGMHQAHQLYGRGGVLSEEDFGNYTTVLQQPAESFYQGHHVMAAPAPSAGAALITALNILEGYNITSQVPRNSTYHWIAESLKIAVALASGLGDPMYDSSISDMVTQMLSKSQAVLLRQMINDSQAFPPGHYTPSYALEEGAVASQVMVMGPDDFIVSVMSSLNRPFGSRIVTPSGILLNSQILDFSWSNKTQTSQPPNPHNVIQPGKRPLSFLVPTAVRPRLGLCGTYVALGSSNGDRALSGITQVLMNVLSSRKNLSDSLAYGRLHPQLQPDTLLVDCEYDILSLVEGTRRTNDLIIGVKDPRSADASALTMSMNMP